MPNRLAIGWKGCRRFWNSKSDLKDQYSYDLWHNTTQQLNQFLPGHMTAYSHVNKKYTVLHTATLICLLSHTFRIVLNPVLLSDSCLHLFLQSALSVSKMEACAAGKTNYSVAQAVQCCGLRRFHSEEALQKNVNLSCDSDSDRYHNVMRCITSLQ